LGPSLKKAACKLYENLYGLKHQARPDEPFGRENPFFVGPPAKKIVAPARKGSDRNSPPGCQKKLPLKKGNRIFCKE